MLKLLVREPGSREAASLTRAATGLVAASIGYVEARAALGGMARAGRLGRIRHDRARADLERIWRGIDVVQLYDRLVRSAGDLADVLRLRAGDAIHLTSALVVEEPEMVFATWDDELRRAARHAGLAVAP